MLVDYIGEEYAVDFFVDEILYVAVYQFGGEANVVGHNGVERLFVIGESRQVGEYHPNTAVGKERVPKGVVFIQVQHPGDSHNWAALCRSFPVEQQLVFERI